MVRFRTWWEQYPWWIARTHDLIRIKEFVAWLQISQVPTVRVHSVSLLAEFVKGFLTNFLLDIAAMLSYKATESFPNSVLPFFYYHDESEGCDVVSRRDCTFWNFRPNPAFSRWRT
jgi:hypothetical protein